MARCESAKTGKPTPTKWTAGLPTMRRSMTVSSPRHERLLVGRQCRSGPLWEPPAERQRTTEMVTEVRPLAKASEQLVCQSSAKGGFGLDALARVTTGLLSLELRDFF